MDRPRTFHKFAGLLTSASLVALMMGAPAAVAPALAVHDDGLFQLDYVTSPTPQGAANVSSTNVTPAGNTGDDWDKVQAGTSSAFASAFITDKVSSAEDSFFDGGGSKDERPINGGNQHWEWDNANDVIPDKDDISHAFAAAYQPTSGQDKGHTIFYFGADRFDTSGDSQIGFWFFKEPVTLGTKPDFVGNHQVGDILVLANWGGSNKVGDINVYKWVGGQSPLLSLKDTTEADCSVAPTGTPNDAVCAVTNNVAGETPPWSYTDKDGHTAYQKSALFEGGIDLNDLGVIPPGGSLGCFSSFLAETRSSHSTDAQLKDFALGAFPVCGIDVKKTGDTLSKIGDPVNYTITIHNTGIATLYKRNITDTLLGAIATDGANVDPNGYVVSNTCGASLAPDDDAAGGADECTITLQRKVQDGDPDPLPNTVSILYTEKADFTGIEFNDSDDHSVNLFQPAILVDKTGDGLSKVGDTASYTFTITNKSSDDSPDLNLASISDNVIGDLKTQATAAGCDVLTYQEKCSFSVSRTVAAGDADPLVNKVDVLYHPTGFPNDIKGSDSHSVNLFQPSVSIEKTGDELSKVGDDVTYNVKITNTSSADSPNLILDSLTDDVLGDLADDAPATCDSLAPGASCEFEVKWTVAEVDVNPKDGKIDDPVINTVTVHFHPQDFPNDITATASHKLNLFQPKIEFSKTADTELSKPTDTVNYTLTLNNLSSADSPDLECTITDTLLGVSKSVTLKAGGSDVTNVPYVVKSTDADPLKNTASVQCSPKGFPNVLKDDDSWTVNLFQPSVTVDKTGDSLSKIGDDVTYHFKITNTSSDDSPNLVLDSVVDDVLGTLSPPSSCDNLAPKGSCEFDQSWTVTAVDVNPADGTSDDPVINTVDVHYHPVGFTNDISDTDTHSLNLFQPGLEFSKSVKEDLSKPTDDVTYTLTIKNTGSADSPDLECKVTDKLLGLADLAVTVAVGDTWTKDYPYTVKTTDVDPLVNEASVTCSPKGFPNVLTGSDKTSTNLFQPSIKVTKTGPAYSKAGDTANYSVKIENTSSADAPDLVFDSFADSLVKSGITVPDECKTLASGASCTITYSYVVQAGDQDPLENTATAHYHPTGFPNDIKDSGSWKTDLLHPTFEVSKVCKSEPISQAGPAVFTITFTNTGDADLHVVPSEGSAFDVAAGATKSYDFSVTGPFTDTVSNTVTGTVTLASRYELANSYTFSKGDSCDVKGKVTVTKTVSGQAPAAGQTFTFELRSGASVSSDGSILETKATDATGNIAFATQLNPGETYQICEQVMPGWNTNLAGDGPLFVPNSVIPPNLPNPTVNNMTVCVDFSVTSGQTRNFAVDNSPPPGGRALTIGFWKNWASCANSNGKGQKPMLDLALGYASKTTANPPGGMVVSAQNAGSLWPNYAAEWYLILKGDPTSTEKNIKPAADCAKAVNLLNKSTIDGKKKMASDPLFNMTAQLVGAQANRFMGAGISGVTITNIDKAVLLDGKYKFNGLTYSPKLTASDTALANCLGTQLDNYNNDRPASACP